MAWLENQSGRGRAERLARHLKRTGRQARLAGGRVRRLTGKGTARVLAAPQTVQARKWFGANANYLPGDALAGVVSALVTIVYCVSFSALIFQGHLQAGLSLGLWGLLLGAAITGIYVALGSSLAPAAAGPDTPAVAVMSVLAASVSAQIMALGGTPELAVAHAMLALSLATGITGIALYIVGRFALGQIVRFVPYPVIGGFLAASGWLMLSGGFEIVTGTNFELTDLGRAIPADSIGKVAVAVTFVAVVVAAKRRWKSVFVLPISFLIAALAVGLILWGIGLSAGAGNWFLQSGSQLEPWVPLRVLVYEDVNWWVFLRVSVEIGAVAGVTLLALLLDVSSLEVARAKVADLDAEFRVNGLANVAAAPFGGLLGNLSMQSSKLLEETGGRTRAGGVFAVVTIGLVLLTGVNLPGLVPTPLLAGLLIYLGLLIIAEGLFEAPARRSWTDMALALAITIAIVEFGYLVGVILGFVGACLMFAFSYSRIGVIRRHLTRAQFSSIVERAPQATRLLRQEGACIHVFWLSGFIFFGSSNGVFERLCHEVRGQQDRPVKYIILDFAAVSGFDTSAVLSLVKLRNYCDEHGITLVYAGLSVTMLVALEEAGLFGAGSAHQAFPSRNEGLEWCEDQILDAAQSGQWDDTNLSFEDWLQIELGADVAQLLVDNYLKRREIDGSQNLYSQGEASDTIDLVAAGSVAICINGEQGRPITIRRMSGKTVVGEMGFFRASPRAASVVSEGPAVIYTMNRSAYDKMLVDHPKVGALFLQFIIRALSNRVEFANQEISSLM